MKFLQTRDRKLAQGKQTSLFYLNKREERTAWIFMSPSLLHLFAFAIYPMVFALVISLYHWNFLADHHHFVGIANYSFALREGSFVASLGNSILYTVLSVPLGMALGLGVAILIAQPLRGMTIVRTIFYLPAICSGVAMSIMWIYIYLPQNGLINTVFKWLHINSSTDFLHNSHLAMLALVVMSTVTGLGPRMILYLSGLINIPTALYEASSIDGASGWKSFCKITLPMLTPTTLFVIVTSSISAMQIFTPIYMMTQGGPEGKTDLIGYHIYVEAWQHFATGLASAESFIMLIVILAMSILQFKLLKDGFDAY